MKKVLLAIRSLDIGGAERYVLELAKNLDKSRFEVTIITMYDGVLDSECSVKHINLKKQGRWDIFSFLSRLHGAIKALSPDIIYTHQGEMNTFCALLKPLLKFRLAWCLHQTFIDFSKYDKMSKLFFYLQAKLSFLPDNIVCVAEAGTQFHANHGFDMRSSTVIKNGIDTSIFLPSNEYRLHARADHNIDDGVFIVGISARVDYMKGYTVIAKAAQNLLAKYPNLMFVSVGKDNQPIRQECETLLGAYNDRFVWLGTRTKMNEIYPMFDCLVSASFGEAFSLAIAEAMSCEVPCIVTDVGDSALIVGDTGIIVQPNDTKRLSDAIEEMLREPRDGSPCRKRIVENFSLSKNVACVEQLLLSI